MRIIVSTHQSNLYNDEVDYLVVSNRESGDFGVMKDHVPVIAVIDDGYIKLVRDSLELYVVIVAGVFEYHDNVATVLAQEAHIGQSIESAKEHLEEIRKERLQINRKENSDFTIKEKELRDHIKRSGAGSI